MYIIYIMSFKKELIAFRNIVDDTLYGAKALNIVAKRKYNLGKEKLGIAMACATRNKIYNDIIDIIYFMRKDLDVISRTVRLEKRIKIHINQMKKLQQANIKDNSKGLWILLHWLKLTQLKQIATKDPDKLYKFLI